MILNNPKEGDLVKVELTLDHKRIEERQGWIVVMNEDGSFLVNCRPTGQIHIEPNGESVNGYFRVIEHHPETNLREQQNHGL